MKILVTGAAGYIGSVLVSQLLNKGFSVRGLDILNFGGESLLTFFNHPNFEFIKGDIRIEDTIKNALKDVYGVVHLAAIVGEPACDQQPDLAKQTNLLASKLLFNLSATSDSVKKFIFASTCSNYGKMSDNESCTEDSKLNPLSLYAELKIEFEKYLLDSKTRNDFIPTALRFSTVYGLSPRIRFDLTINEFIKEVAMNRELVIFGKQFWRPYCHVEDLASACVLVLESEASLVDHNVFNVGDTRENYQKQMIAEEILKLVPDARIKYMPKENDPRDFRVDFSKIKNKLRFSIKKTVPDGLREIYSIIKSGIISNPDSQIYKNI
jgi:nucleoside-diphosphate-sugar epimerase